MVTTATKVVFFCLSVVSMAGFAGAALLMANNAWGWGGLLLLCSLCVIAAGFVVRVRVLGARR